MSTTDESIGDSSPLPYADDSATSPSSSTANSSPPPLDGDGISPLPPSSPSPTQEVDVLSHPKSAISSRIAKAVKKGQSLSFYYPIYNFSSQESMTKWVNTTLIPAIYPYVHWRLTAAPNSKACIYTTALSKSLIAPPWTPNKELGLHASSLQCVLDAIAAIRSMAERNAGTEMAPRFEDENKGEGERSGLEYGIYWAWCLLMFLNKGMNGYLRERKKTTKVWMPGYVEWRDELEKAEREENEDDDDDDDDDDAGEVPEDSIKEDSNDEDFFSFDSDEENYDAVESKDGDQLVVVSPTQRNRRRRRHCRRSYFPGFTFSMAVIYAGIRILPTPVWSETLLGRQTLEAEEDGEFLRF